MKYFNHVMAYILIVFNTMNLIVGTILYVKYPDGKTYIMMLVSILLLLYGIEKLIDCKKIK